ncbi:MAG: TlpA disulfide reductase family protein [Bacteroidota bacterium]
MNPFKFFAILLFSMLIFSTWNSAEASLIFRSDTLSIGDEAPQFVMRNLMTNTGVFLRDFTGKTLREPWKKKERQVVVLSFWATWCQPCKNEIPILTKLAADYKDQNVKFFLVNTMEKAESNEDSVRDMYKNRGYTLQCLVDPSGRYTSLYSVHGLPVLVVIDKFGIVRKINHGYHENFQIELETLIKELLKEEEPAKK